MKSMITVLLSLFFLNTFSQAAVQMVSTPREMPSEAWLELNCRGVVTPQWYGDRIFKDVTKFYVQVDPSKPRPSIRDMAKDPAYRDRFTKWAHVCTDKRLKMQLPYIDASHTFLDWGTEWGYSRFILKEVFVPANTACRTVGQPCARISQCCGYANPVTTRNTCDLVANSCVRTMNVSDATENAVQVKSN